MMYVGHVGAMSTVLQSGGEKEWERSGEGVGKEWGQSREGVEKELGWSGIRVE